MAWNLDDYEPVEDRIRKFWKDWPDGKLLTELMPSEPGTFIVKATAFRDNTPASTGYAQEVVTDRGVNSTSALENCETSAIGRALANLGYAAKGARPSREEMVKTVQTKDGTGAVKHEFEDASAYLAAEVENRFALWTVDQQKKAGTEAAKTVKPGKPVNRAEADQLLHVMEQAYYVEFPAALPL